MSSEPARPLDGRVALVAGATRGSGRGIAVQLGAAGATVYATGRSSRHHGRSEMDRPETIEETAELVEAAGGRAIAVRADHGDQDEVRRLIDRIGDETGRLDVLVNDIWGGDPIVEWGKDFWEHDLDSGLRAVRNAIETHIVTTWHAAPLLFKSDRGLVIEVTDGTDERYRGSFFYDLAKTGVLRLVVGQAIEMRKHGVAVVALTPGFLRSEAMLDHFGVTEETWREGIAQDEHFAHSETPTYIGRAVAALAADPDILELTGKTLATWTLKEKYGFVDADGSRPDWGAHAATLDL